MRQTSGMIQPTGMRQTMGNLDESILNSETSIQQFHDRKRRNFACKTGLWIMSNVLTFIVGYYVKGKYYVDDCSVDGSQ